MLRINTAQSDFGPLRLAGNLYVDKTRQIYHFLQRSGALMYTRPRRFGKTLLLSTIAALYRGNPAPFALPSAEVAPLWIHQSGLWNWQVEQRPVLRMDMQRLKMLPGETATAALFRLVDTTAYHWGMTGRYRRTVDEPVQAWEDLLRQVAYLYQPGRELDLPEAIPKTAAVDEAWYPDTPLIMPCGQVQGDPLPCLVLLIDEYDAPILNHLTHPQAPELRVQLADMYGVTKRMGSFIHRLVMTGITRFVREDMWSKLNHVSDVTQERHFHDLTGFTEADLDWLQSRADAEYGGHECHSYEPALLLEAWRSWYNGYRFSLNVVEHIYNPYAILQSLQTGEIREFWFDSGHLGAIEALMRKPWHIWQNLQITELYAPTTVFRRIAGLDMQVLDSLVPDKDSEEQVTSHSPRDLSDLPLRQISILLHQAGYLTLAPNGRLTVPNREVAQNIGYLLLSPYFQEGQEDWSLDYIEDMYSAATRLHFPDLVATFNQFLHQFPHQRFTKAGEIPYNLLFDVSMMLMKPRVSLQTERSSLLGDADTVVEWDDITLVVEFKHEASSFQRGWEQLISREYARYFADKKPFTIGLSLNIVNRQVEEWICDALRQDGTPQKRELTHRSPWPDSLDLRQHFERQDVSGTTKSLYTD